MGFWRDGDTIMVVNKWADPGTGKRCWMMDRYYVDNGMIQKSSRAGNSESFYAYKDGLVEWFVKCGYPYASFDEKFALRVIEPFINQPIEAAEKYLAECGVRLEERKKEIREQAARNRQLWDRFGGYVVGLAKEIEVYRGGFSVRVLLSSGRSFKERIAFVRKNRKDLLKWTMEEIANTKKMTCRIGSIKFCKPVEVTVLKSAEVEIKFEVKDTSAFLQTDYQ